MSCHYIDLRRNIFVGELRLDYDEYTFRPNLVVRYVTTTYIRRKMSMFCLCACVLVLEEERSKQGETRTNDDGDDRNLKRNGDVSS